MNMELKPKQKVTEMKVLPYIKSGHFLGETCQMSHDFSFFKTILRIFELQPWKKIARLKKFVINITAFTQMYTSGLT